MKGSLEGRVGSGCKTARKSFMLISGPISPGDFGAKRAALSTGVSTQSVGSIGAVPSFIQVKGCRLLGYVCWGCTAQGPSQRGRTG